MSESMKDALRGIAFVVFILCLGIGLVSGIKYLKDSGPAEQRTKICPTCNGYGRIVP